jgi:hypothetical protein
MRCSTGLFQQALLKHLSSDKKAVAKMQVDVRLVVGQLVGTRSSTKRPRQAVATWWKREQQSSTFQRSRLSLDAAAYSQRLSLPSAPSGAATSCIFAHRMGKTVSEPMSRMCCPR